MSILLDCMCILFGTTIIRGTELFLDSPVRLSVLTIMMYSEPSSPPVVRVSRSTPLVLRRTHGLGLLATLCHCSAAGPRNPLISDSMSLHT